MTVNNAWVPLRTTGLPFLSLDPVRASIYFLRTYISFYSPFCLFVFFVVVRACSEVLHCRLLNAHDARALAKIRTFRPLLRSPLDGTNLHALASCIGPPDSPFFVYFPPSDIISCSFWFKFYYWGTKFEMTRRDHRCPPVQPPSPRRHHTPFPIPALTT